MFWSMGFECKLPVQLPGLKGRGMSSRVLFPFLLTGMWMLQAILDSEDEDTTIELGEQQDRKCLGPPDTFAE